MPFDGIDPQDLPGRRDLPSEEPTQSHGHIIVKIALGSVLWLAFCYVLCSASGLAIEKVAGLSDFLVSEIACFHEKNIRDHPQSVNRCLSHVVHFEAEAGRAISRRLLRLDREGDVSLQATSLLCPGDLEWLTGKAYVEYKGSQSRKLYHESCVVKYFSSSLCALVLCLIGFFLAMTDRVGVFFLATVAFIIGADLLFVSIFLMGFHHEALAM